MKNRISLSGMANDVRRLGRPVRCVLAVFVVACVVVLLLAAGSLPLQAQARTAPEDEQAFHRLVGRPEDDKRGRPQHPDGPKLDGDE